MPDLQKSTIVFVLGAPGAGKGTQCAKIVEKYGWSHLSTGDLLRAAVAAGTELGQQAQELMQSGQMVPTSLVLDLLLSAMESDGSDKFLVDGFPRKLDQLMEFEEKIKPADMVLVFSLPEDVAVDRLVKRGETSGRADDNEETIRARMQVFSQESEPVIEHLKGSGRVAEIDAQDDVDTVFDMVRQHMATLAGPTTRDTEEPAPEPAAAEEGEQPAAEETEAAAAAKEVPEAAAEDAAEADAAAAPESAAEDSAEAGQEAGEDEAAVDSAADAAFDDDAAVAQPDVSGEGDVPAADLLDESAGAAEAPDADAAPVGEEQGDDEAAAVAAADSDAAPEGAPPVADEPTETAPSSEVEAEAAGAAAAEEAAEEAAPAEQGSEEAQAEADAAGADVGADVDADADGADGGADGGADVGAGEFTSEGSPDAVDEDPAAAAQEQQQEQQQEVEQQREQQQEQQQEMEQQEMELQEEQGQEAEEDLPKLDDFTDQEVVTVTKIQAAGRGMLERKRVRELKAQEQHVAELAASVHALVVVCGPSGVGKGTLIGRLMSEHSDKFGFSVSHTTRGPRPGEEDSVHYHFVDQETISLEIEAGGFLEYAQVHGNTYGTSLQAVADVCSSQRIPVLDIDVQGAMKVKSSVVSDKATFVFVAPPSMEQLEARLRGRGTETEDKIRMRLSNAQSEMDQSEEPGLFHAIVVNDDLDSAYLRLKQVIEQHVPGTFQQEALQAAAAKPMTPPPAAASPIPSKPSTPLLDQPTGTASKPSTPPPVPSKPSTPPPASSKPSTPQLAAPAEEAPVPPYRAPSPPGTAQARPSSKPVPPTEPPAVSPPARHPLKQQHSMGRDGPAMTSVRSLPVRQYMDSTVVPILREALRALNESRPSDPLQFLADYLLSTRAKMANSGYA